MQIEERIDQIKNCWWVGCFANPNFNADVVHVYFVLLTYRLIQFYLKATQHEELATQTIETLKQEERLGKDAVIVYAEKYFAVFDLLDGNKKRQSQIAPAFFDSNEYLEKLYLHEKSQKFIRPNESTRGPIKCHLNEE